MISQKDIISKFKNIFSSAGTSIVIEMGASSVKIAEVKKAPKGVILNNLIFLPIPKELASKEAEFSAFLVNILKKAIEDNKLTAQNVFIVLGGKEVNMVALSLPKVSAKDLKNVIEINLRKQINFNPDESSFAYQMAGEVIDAKGVKQEIIAVVVSKRIIENKVEIIRRSGLVPSGIGIIPNALGNILRENPSENPEEVVVFVDIGAKQSILSIFRGGELQFTRDVSISGDGLTQSLVRKITLPDKVINITFDDAEKIKRDCGIPQKEELEEKVNGISKAHILTMMKANVDRLSNDILRSINFYRQRFKGTKIDRVILTGGGSKIKNLDKFLAGTVKDIKIEYFDPLFLITGWGDSELSNQDIFNESPSSLSVLLGLSLGEKKGNIELLPFEVKLQQKLKSIKTILLITVPCFLVVLLMFFAILSAQRVRYRSIFRQAQNQLNSFELKRQMIEEYDMKSKKMQQRKSLLDQAVGRQPIWWGVLKEIGLITPTGVTLDRMYVVVEERPLKLKLEGTIVPSYTTIDLALSQYLLALDESPFFENVDLVSQSRDMYSSTPKANFEILLQLVY